MMLVQVQRGTQKWIIMNDIPKQENIKEQVEQAFADLKHAYASIELIEGRIHFLRKICEHPETVKVSHIGHLFNRCTTCGQEW